MNCVWSVNSPMWYLYCANQQARPKTNTLAHKGHLHVAIVRTKQNLRTKVWWPCMDKAAEKICKYCYECQLVAHPWAADINDIAKGSLVRPSHRPSTATPIWTIHTTCHQLLWPLSWVSGSNWQPRGDPHQPWSSHNYHIRQWTITLIKKILRILQAEWHCAS